MCSQNIQVYSHSNFVTNIYNLNPKPSTRGKHYKGSGHSASSIYMKGTLEDAKEMWAWRSRTEIVTKSKLITWCSWGWRWRLLDSKHLVRSHIFNVVQNPIAVEKRQYIPSQKKSHNISLHNNVFDSNLDKNYIPLHPSSWTHNYFIDPTTHF